MAAIENHLDRIKEHLEEISDAIDSGIENRPITLGFHCSACATELLEVYLHKIKKIPVSKTIKHTWFRKPKEEQKVKALIERKLGVNFPKKREIYGLIYIIEENRDNLIYGKSTRKTIETVISSFNKLKEILTKKIKDEGLDIEKK